MFKTILIAVLAALTLVIAGCGPVTEEAETNQPSLSPSIEEEEADGEEIPEEECAELPEEECEDMQTIEGSAEQELCAKPVIYLYPEEKTEVSVKLDYDGRFTCTYPAYENGWHVTASPDGTLTDEAGQTYRYLYWEGEGTADVDFSFGFSVAGCDTAEFLEDALAQLGLNREEANEFIVYWLPQMQENEYNLISFQTETYTEHARLTVEPAPDTVIRVFMAWKKIPAPVNLAPQILTAPERTGFTVVEWGGTKG